MSDEQFKGTKDVDWEAIERDYRAGVLSLREIAKKHGMNPKNGHVYIKRRADSADPPWERDLQAKVQAKAEAIVAKRQVREEQLAKGRVHEQAIIDANAIAVADVRMSHRLDIRSASEVGAKLRQQLQHVVDNQADYEKLGELMFSPDDKGRDKLNEIYQATIGLPTMVKTLKDLASAMDSLISLEREAWAIGQEKDDPNTGGSMRNLTDAERVTRLMNLLDVARTRAAEAPQEGAAA